MDSNFKVKVTADLSDLVAKIKNIEVTLAKLDSSFKTVSGKATRDFKDVGTSVSNVGVDMNRARLATFAFGQVIRDAGFFSQSFGLGLLAISNNVPILIDQLVMLSGMSAAAGAAISLLGSVLTAGLTIFAYWAQGVQRDGKSVGGELQKMALDSQGAIGKLVDFLSKPPASEILNKIIGGVLTGFEALKSLFNASISAIKTLWNRFGDDLANSTTGIFGYLKNTVKNVLSVILSVIKLTTGLISGDFDLMRKSIVNIFKSIFNQVINIWSTLISGLSAGIGYLIKYINPQLSAFITQAGKNFQQFAQKNQFATEKIIDFNFNLKDTIRSLEFSDEKVKNNSKSTDKLGDVYKELAIDIQNINLNKLSTDLEKANKLVEVHQKALESLVKLGLGPTTKEYKALSDELFKAMKKLNDEEGKVFDGKLQSIILSNKAKKAAEAQADAKEKEKNLQEELNKLGTDSAAMKTADDPTMDILNKRNEKVTEFFASINRTRELILDMGQILVGPLAGAFQTMMQSGVFSFKTLVNALGQVVTKLIAAIAAAAILAALISIITGGKNAAKGGMSFATAFTSLMGGKGMFPGTKFAEGGIVSGPTNALIGEYPGARNNPEVVAPLDKLKSLIPSGGDMIGGGTLTAKISGNDLLILVDRARKNRNGYY